MRLSLVYENPLYDAGAGVAVGVLLGAVGGVLATLNGRYLIGAAVEDAVLVDIERTLRRRPSVDDVHAVQSQRVGPDAFAYKCEVDFDGARPETLLSGVAAPPRIRPETGRGGAGAATRIVLCDESRRRRGSSSV